MRKLGILICVLLLAMPIALAGTPVTIVSKSLRGNGGTAAIGGVLEGYSVMSYFNGHAIQRILGVDDPMTTEVDEREYQNQGQTGFAIQAMKSRMVAPFNYAREQVSIRTMGSAKLSNDPELTWTEGLDTIIGLRAGYAGNVHYYKRTYDPATKMYSVTDKTMPATFTLAYNAATGMTTISGSMDGMAFSMSDVPTTSI